eukprot:1161387-Pelagomonas_calceolata.AAC.12
MITVPFSPYSSGPSRKGGMVFGQGVRHRFNHHCACICDGSCAHTRGSKLVHQRIVHQGTSRTKLQKCANFRDGQQGVKQLKHPIRENEKAHGEDDASNLEHGFLDVPNAAVPSGHYIISDVREVGSLSADLVMVEETKSLAAL